MQSRHDVGDVSECFLMVGAHEGPYTPSTTSAAVEQSKSELVKNVVRNGDSACDDMYWPVAVRGQCTGLLFYDALLSHVGPYLAAAG